MPQILDYQGAALDWLSDVRTQKHSYGRVFSFTFVEYDGRAYYCMSNQKVSKLKETRLISLPKSPILSMQLLASVERLAPIAGREVALGSLPLGLSDFIFP